MAASVHGALAFQPQEACCPRTAAREPGGTPGTRSPRIYYLAWLSYFRFSVGDHHAEESPIQYIVLRSSQSPTIEKALKVRAF